MGFLGWGKAEGARKATRGRKLSLDEQIERMSMGTPAKPVAKKKAKPKK